MAVARILICMWTYWLVNLQTTIAYGDESDSFPIDTWIRLVGRRPDDVTLPLDNDAYFGRVEIYSINFSKWISVCSTDWGINEANVVCRQLGFPGALSAHGNAYYGEGYGSDLMGVVRCQGNEKWLSECEYDSSTPSCGHSDDVGVVCVQPDLYYPRISYLLKTLEVWDGVRWRTVCTQKFEKEEATTACKHLGYEGLNSWSKTISIENNAPPLIFGFSCNSEDEELSDCTTTKINSSDCGNVELHCSPDEGEVRLDGERSGDVTLPPGYDAYYGRVEIYHDLEWASVCGTDWGIDEAEVVCRQLGFPRAVSAHGDAYYGEGHGSNQLGGVSCNGDEEKLVDCEHDPWTPASCGHSDDVGVICVEPDLYYPRLVGTRHTLEVWDGARWSRVCSQGFEGEEATTVCKHLGFRSLDSWDTNSLEKYETPTVNVSFSCDSGDKELSDCNTTKIDTSECGNVFLKCESFESYWYDQNHLEGEDGDIRLVGKMPNEDTTAFPPGHDAYYGRVEIYHGSEWGSVCDVDWGSEEAEVVCRQLGFPGAVSAYGNAYYGEGHGAVLLGGVRCQGNEGNLDECERDPWSQPSCGHSDDVGVICVTPDLYYPRFVRGFERVLEVWDGVSWKRVCSKHFDVNEAKAACKNLGFLDFSFGYRSDFEYDDAPPLDLGFSCSQWDEKLSDCSTEPIDTSDCGSVRLTCEEYSFFTSPYAIILYNVGIFLVAIPLGVYLKRRRKRRFVRTVTTVTVDGATAAQPDDSNSLGNVPYERFE